MRATTPRADRSPFPLRGEAVLACLLALGAAAATGVLPGAAAVAHAQDQAADIDLPAQPLEAALHALSRQTGAAIAVDAALAAGKQAPALRGRYTPREALDRLLAGSGLVAVTQGGAFVLRPAPAPDAAEANTLQEVTVTAPAVRAGDLPEAYAGGQVARGGRVGMLGNQDVMDTPFNQSIYTSELIRNQQAVTVGDVLDNDPAVRRDAPPSGTYEFFNIRGFSVTTGDMMFNGLYGMLPYYSVVPVEFIERVEVLKGPSALLGGMSPNGAVGGAINIVPKRAADEPLTRLTLGVESRSLWRGHVDVGRRFGTDGEWGVRFNGSYKSGDSYVDGQSRKGDVGALALDYRGERLRVALDVFRLHNEVRGGESVVAYAGNGLPRAPDGHTNIVPGLYFPATTEGVLLSGELDINEHLTAFAKIGTRRYEQKGGQQISAVSDLDALGNGTLALWSWAQNHHSVTGEAGIRASFRTGPLKHALVISGSRLDSENRESRYLIRQSTNIYSPAAIAQWPAEPGNLVKTSDGTLSGLAIADTMSFAEDRVLLTLGIRRQTVKADSFNLTSGLLTASYDQHAWTPMAGIVFKARGNLSLYANAIEGLSQGTIVGSTYQNAGEVFPPYKTKQLEVGAKLETGGIVNTLSVFQIRKPSTTVDDSTTPLPTLRLNGEQRNRGIEWAIFGEVSPSVRLLGGVTYTQPELTRTQGGMQDGNHAAGAAPWTANLGAEWDLPGVPGLTLSGRALYTGAQYANNANTFKLSSWTRVDIGARYATKIGNRATVFRAGISNLFDRNYWLSTRSYGAFSLAAPRTFQVSATIDF
ncbi:MAG: TonB-dependent receptor [Burkholderiaceae bacterium]